jgi:hypothetical protein
MISVIHLTKSDLIIVLIFSTNILATILLPLGGGNGQKVSQTNVRFLSHSGL